MLYPFKLAEIQGEKGSSGLDIITSTEEGYDRSAEYTKGGCMDITGTFSVITSFTWQVQWSRMFHITECKLLTCLAQNYDNHKRYVKSKSILYWGLDFLVIINKQFKYMRLIRLLEFVRYLINYVLFCALKVLLQ